MNKIATIVLALTLCLPAQAFSWKKFGKHLGQGAIIVLHTTGNAARNIQESRAYNGLGSNGIHTYTVLPPMSGMPSGAPATIIQNF